MDKRLPYNEKEGLIYGGIIALITVIVMLFLNIGTSFGMINLKVLLIILKMIPIIWLTAMLVEHFIVGKISDKLMSIFTTNNDSFNSKVLFNILFCVTGMSMIMTILGSMIGQGKLSLEPFATFLTHWPRNFCVAFWCEILLAQPAARYIMKLIHSRCTKKATLS